MPFPHMEDIPQLGSLEAEAGVLCSTLDVMTRLNTGGADMPFKVYSEQAQIVCYLSLSHLLSYDVSLWHSAVRDHLVAVLCYARSTCSRRRESPRVVRTATVALPKGCYCHIWRLDLKPGGESAAKAEQTVRHHTTL
ncbi:hypothetical protein PENSPDRAFT_51784 [Peniophora sp. CONT]|nr:hypothetical protein PENSPDRAFT_51784 [Peniophora sp. CONT]